MPSNTAINCTAGTVQGHLDDDKDGPASGTWIDALFAMGPVFTGCTLGADKVTFQCTGGMRWNAETYNGGTPTKLADTPGKVTDGKFTAVDCTMSLDPAGGGAKVGCGDFDGTARGTYTNSNGAAKPIITMSTTEQKLERTAVACGTVPASDTTITIGAPGAGGADLNPLLLTLQAPANPILWYGSNP